MMVIQMMVNGCNYFSSLRCSTICPDELLMVGSCALDHSYDSESCGGGFRNLPSGYFT